MRNPLPLLLIFCVSSWMLACGASSDSEEESKHAKVKTASEDFATRLDLALAQKKDWYAHWTEEAGKFDATAFELVFKDSLDGFEMPEKNPILESDPLFPYQLQHPAGNGAVDIYSYKVEAQDEFGNPYLNPDSEVTWYKGDGMKERLLFMGPSGMFEDGMWLNENELLILGYLQEEEGFRPMVWLIDVSKHLIWQYKMTETFPKYEPMSFIDQKIRPLDLK